MILARKLIFAPIFLIIFAFTCFRLSPFLTSYNVLFSLDVSSIVQIIVICALLLVSSLLFTLFITFCQDLKLIAPVVIVASISPIIFLPKTVSWILAVGFIAAFLLTFFNLNSKLKTYLTFQPTTLFAPSIKTLSTLLILILSVGFYISINSQIKQAGFTIPDSLIDTALRTMPGQFEQAGTTTLPGLDQIGPEQIAMLKQNPNALKQFGLDPKILDNTDKPSDLIRSTIRDSVKSQVDQIIKPYLAFIPIFLSLSFFLTLNWIVSILSLFLYPLLWFTFYILTKSGFAQFTTEMREVKKLVV